jgi:hypothetical protein
VTYDPETAAEERRLWADYYESLERALKIMRTEGTGAVVLQRVAAEQALANGALERIKKIRGGRTDGSGP